MSNLNKSLIQGWLNKLKSSKISIGGHWNRRYF